METRTHSAPQTASTGQVAKAVGVSKSTLIRWIKCGFLPEPELVLAGQVGLRVWRKEDYLRALRHRERYYWLTRDQIKRGTDDGGTQRGTESPRGDEQGGGTPTPEATSP